MSLKRLGERDGSPRISVAAAGRLRCCEEREVSADAVPTRLDVQPASERERVVVHVARAVRDEVLAPGVEDVPVRVQEPVGEVALNAARARFVAPHAAVAVAQHAVQRLDLRAVEDALLEVEGAVGPEDEAVGRVVRVGRAQTVQEALAVIGATVPVGVLQEDEVGSLRDQHAAVPELESGRVVQVVGEGRADIGAAVAVEVLEDQQLVVGQGAGPPGCQCG